MFQLLPLEKRLATFMNIFIGAPSEPSRTLKTSDQITEVKLGNLVNKIMACLHQQEQVSLVCT